MNVLFIGTPMVFTTNKPLGGRDGCSHDPDLVEAILDRVLEGARHLELRGASYRTRRLTLDLTQVAGAASLAAQNFRTSPARVFGLTAGRSGRGGRR